MKKNYYDILGFSNSERKKQGDDFEKILKAKYRKLSMKYHPDRHANESDDKKKAAEEKFKEVAEAYAVLSDKEKRQHYDTYGSIDGFGANGGFSPDDIMREFMRRNPFSGFGFGDMGGEPVYRGSDKKLRISVTVEDVYFQRLKDVTYDVDIECEKCGGKGSRSGKDTTCPYCNGTGRVVETKQWGGGIMQSSHVCPNCGGTGRIVSDPCGDCGGTGVQKKTVNRQLKVPKIDGLNNTYKIGGEGNACPNGRGVKGDLYFTFALRNDPNSKFYVTEGMIRNIFTDANVSVFDCITGSEIDVPTVDGRTLKLKIPMGTKDGEIFRFRNEGFVDSVGYKGDLCVKINMVMPSNLTEEDIVKIKEVSKEIKK